MAIVRAAASAAVFGTGSVTPAAPATGVVGDLWFCAAFASNNNAPDITMDAAWTRVDTSAALGSHRLSLFSYPWQGSDPPNRIVTAAGLTLGAFTASYRPDTGFILSVDASATSLAGVAPAINFADAAVSQANDMCLFLWGFDIINTAGLGAVSGTDPVPTEIVDANDGTISYEIGYADGLRTAATSTGPRTANRNATETGVKASIVATLKQVAATSAVLSGTVLT